MSGTFKFTKNETRQWNLISIRTILIAMENKSLILKSDSRWAAVTGTSPPNQITLEQPEPTSSWASGSWTWPMQMPGKHLSQFQFTQVNLWLGVSVGFVIYLLAKGAQLCECGYQVNLSWRTQRHKLASIRSDFNSKTLALSAKTRHQYLTS